MQQHSVENAATSDISQNLIQTPKHQHPHKI